VIPHPDPASGDVANGGIVMGNVVTVRCAVITISDTRTPETDQSGQVVRTLLQAAGHELVFYQIVPDEPQQILVQIQQLLMQHQVQVLLLNGGTGIAPRDSTYEAIVGCLTQILPGFGELFRALSYAEIGSRAMASRAVAGVAQGKLLFAMPGSTNAVSLAMEKLILPELIHLSGQLRQGRS
jgi:molybdopterin adenylyltransferase